MEATHLSLQKTIYFLHGRYLRSKKRPLVAGHFEAWQHGPVHPQVWTAFKSAGRDPITRVAGGMDLLTGEQTELPGIQDSEVRRFITAQGLELLRLPAGRLVGLSHATGGPWDEVTKLSGGQREYGARISDELILKCFNRHMIPIREAEANGVDLDEQPPA